MAFALPVWLAVHEELLRHGEADCGTCSCFDEFDDEALFQLFHLSRPCVAFIADAVRGRLKTLPLDEPGLPADAMVMLALNYYAHGVNSAPVLQRVGLSQADGAALVVGTVSGVVAAMSDEFISFPLSPGAKANVASKVEGLCGIPRVLGVLAPAHFKIRASPYEKNSFRSFVNTLGYTSVVSQIVCDSDGNVLSVDRCCVGSTCEQEMWESSSEGKEMEKELLGLTPFCITHILTPLSVPDGESEIRFNEAHAKIHSVMRTTLGSLKRRFRCLMQLGFAQEASLNKKSNIIKACCVLHNIAKKFSVPPPPPAGKIEALHPGKQLSAPAEVDPEALQARQKVIDENFSVVSSSQDPAVHMRQYCRV
uniref:Putative nuclease HARBI1 n=1 Tax=Scophthalmus maximus TaxID=52904 RepID=A0A8D3DG73_SCOMX